MLISVFSKNRLSFWKSRFFFDYRIRASLAAVYYVTCRPPCGTE